MRNGLLSSAFGCTLSQADAERMGFSRDSFSGAFASPFASPCGPARAQPRLAKAKAQHAFGQTAPTQAALPHEPRAPAPVLRLGHRRGLVRADDAVLGPGHLRPVGLPARLRGQRALFDGTGLAGLGPVLGLGWAGQRAAGVIGCRMRRLGFVAAGLWFFGTRLAREIRKWHDCSCHNWPLL